MKLEAFRVQNYKKIRDTGWINCRDLTVFVGKNEAGKSALFRGLSKLNPSDAEKYDGLKEFPRRRLTDEFQEEDWPVASGRFALTDEEKETLMVDIDHLERTRVVFEDDEGATCVSEDVWPRDKDSLFPLQAGLGYQLAQALFISKRQLIVEGLTDLWLIKALGQALAAEGRTVLREDIVVVPAAGVTKLLPLASMLIGHDVDVVALLDGDEPGRREGRKLVQKLLGGDAGRCLFLGDFVPEAAAAELEDVFPEEEYLGAVKEAYNLKSGIKFDKKEKGLDGIVNRINAYFERKGLGRLEKWRPAAVLRDRILADPTKVPEQVKDTMAAVFQAINDAFGVPDE